jgi:hypothetical protein
LFSGSLVFRLEKSFGCEAEAPETFFDRELTLAFTAAMKLTL